MIENGSRLSRSSMLNAFGPLILACHINCQQCLLLASINKYICTSQCCMWWEDIHIFLILMDPNASRFLFNPSTLQSVYYEAKENDDIIDLGLSLRALQPETYHPSEQCKFLLSFVFLIYGSVLLCDMC